MDEANPDAASADEVNTQETQVQRGTWLELGITALATLGLLTLVIGGAILIRSGFDEPERRERILRVQPVPDEPEQYCYEEVVPRNGGLFGDRDDQGDDFDAEAQFADGGERRVIIVCEDW